jgi:hypothetical protein
MDVPDMTKRQILRMFVKDYIKSGYLYSGSIPQNATVFYHNKTNYERALDLIKEGKLEFAKNEARSFILPLEQRKKLIENHGLADRWEKTAPYFHPNGPYGEVTCVYGRTQEVLKAHALARLHQNEHGYYACFDSKHGNGTYKTQYWTRDWKQFKAGMITCDCPGWRFRRQCTHQDDMRELLIEAMIIK